MTVIQDSKSIERHQPGTPRPHAALPEDWTRNRLMNLVQRVGRAIGLNPTDIAALRRLTDNTPNEHFQSRVRSPICFERQVDMANDLGISDKQFRRIEVKLHNLGLIRRDTAVNGYRGGRFNADGVSYLAGISIEPLIEKLEHLMAVEAQLKHDAELAAQYRSEISVLRRRLILALPDLEGTALQEQIEADKASWPRPRSIATLEGLDQHFFALSELWGQVQEYLTSCREDMSGAPDINDRRHIHNTTNSNIETRSGASNEATHIRPADKSAGTDLFNAPPNGEANYLEKSIKAETDQEKTKFIENLTPRQFFSLASDDMRLYLTGSGPAPTQAELDYAASMRLRDLGVNISAWNDAIEAMGWSVALLSLIIIDRNTNRNPNPVRNPGAMLRAYTRSWKSNELNLAGSVYGIWNRSEGERLH